jgi:hypothetical protein
VREERNLFCRAPQSAFEFGVEFAADRGHLLVAELPKECGGLVVFKGRGSRRVHHPQDFITPQPTGRRPGEVGASGLEGFLEDVGIGEGEIRRRTGIDELLGEESDLLAVGRVEVPLWRRLGAD